MIDSYAKFLKYDDDHYLLGIRENGINEGNPSLSQQLKDRAAAYPDRSIIWIDAHTGKSLGIALKTEVFAVSLDASSQKPDARSGFSAFIIVDWGLRPFHELVKSGCTKRSKERSDACHVRPRTAH